MAFVPNAPQTDPNAPQQPNPNAPNTATNVPPATSGAASGTSGSASGAGTGQGAVSVPNASKAPPVQNLQDYLVANAPQAAGMGQKIADNLTAGASKVSGDINADQQAIDQQVQANNVAPDQALIDRAAANPSGFVQNPDDLAAFLKQRDASYGGPGTAEATPEWQGLTNEVENAFNSAPDMTQPGAFEQLARGQETNPTSGMTALDAALLQGTPGAAGPINAAAAPYKALPGQLTSAASAENAKIRAAQANDTAAAGAIAPKFLTGPNAVVPAWAKTLGDELAAAQGKETAYNAAVNSSGSAAAASKAAIEAAKAADMQKITQGVVNTGNAGTDAIWQGRVKGYIDPTAYENELTPFLNLQPMTAAPTMASTSTAQDYATEKALEQLLGSRLGTTPINQSTVGQAGSFTVPTNPNAPPDLSGIPQYMNDITGEYTTPTASFTNATIGNTSDTQTPAQIAQRLLDLGTRGGQGVTLTPAITAELQRIIANQYAGR